MMLQEGGGCGSSPDISVNPQHPKRGQTIVVKVSRLGSKTQGRLLVSLTGKPKLAPCAKYAWEANSKGVAIIRLKTGTLPQKYSEFTLVIFKKDEDEEKEVLREKVTILED